MKFAMKNMKFAFKNMKYSIKTMKFSIKSVKFSIKNIKFSIKNMNFSNKNVKFSVYKVHQNLSFVLFVTEFLYLYRKNAFLNGKQKQMKPLLDATSYRNFNFWLLLLMITWKRASKLAYFSKIVEIFNSGQNNQKSKIMFHQNGGLGV